jgi:ribosomal RNA-processing protein 7
VLPPPGATASIVFLDAASLAAVLRAARKKLSTGVSWPSPSDLVSADADADTTALGSARYRAHHSLRYPPPASLLSVVDAYMTLYAAAETAKVQAAKQARSEPDEDGFVTVTRGGRTAPVRQEKAQERRKVEEERMKEREVKDFYRFQSREERKRVARELVEGMERDRERVREMKGRRVFKVSD